MKIGVMVESFRAGLDGGLKAAGEVGADGVQIFATRGETHPDKLTAAGRAELKRKLADHGLELAALCGDFGHGFQDPDANPKLVADSKKILDMALELGCTVVTTHVGVIPADASAPRYAVMAKAAEELGRYGEQIGATFAIETGPEPAAVLRAFLDDIGIPKGMGVNFDPANLVMLLREDVPAAVAALAPYIVHTHAKDGRNLQPVGDMEVLYGLKPPPDGKKLKWGEYMAEVPLGEGDVDFDGYLSALRSAGFDGYLTIEREVGDNPRKDIEAAVKFLRERIG
ncbi:MAG TPA: sugar phosphate isomerase/epimerase family protein [Phycisphaerae bacterium]|nr:sugar phosphate isomerase/epimerase family protein [Phycisphaerae bacterium]